MPKHKNSQRGFTLIELMVVVAIIGTLGAIVVPRFTAAQEAARTARVQADLRAIESAIVMFEADVGILPTKISDLTTAYSSGESNSPQFGPYLKTTPVPPVGGTVRVVDANGNLATETARTYSVGTSVDNKGRAIFNDTYTVENIRVR